MMDMKISVIGNNVYCDMVKPVADKNRTTQNQVMSNQALQTDSVDISDEGWDALHKKLQEAAINKGADDERLSVANTNEVEFEHYTTMLRMSGDVLKDGNYDIKDVMKSVMDTYETVYNDIVKAHQDGDRQANYRISGETSLTLEQDLEGLDKVFQRRMADLEGYITCQQTNKQFVPSGYSEYMRHKGIEADTKSNEAAESDDLNQFDTGYKDTVISIMQQAKNNFLEQIRNGTYKKGMGVSMLLDSMGQNLSFIEGTKKLFDGGY